MIEDNVVHKLLLLFEIFDSSGRTDIVLVLYSLLRLFLEIRIVDNTLMRNAGMPINVVNHAAAQLIGLLHVGSRGIR